MSLLADRLFDGFFAECQLEELLEEFLGEPHFDHYDRLTWDYYDRSFELKGARDGLVFTPEHLSRLAALGFDRCWICYCDGDEKYYPLANLRRPTDDPGGGGR